MVCRPASRVMATKGMPRQMFAAMVENRASHGWPRKSMYWLMTVSYTHLTLPTIYSV